MDRVDAVVPVERPSNYRKRAYSVFYELPLVAPDQIVARIDAMLAPEHIAGFEAHRAQRQPTLLAAFKTASLAAIREVNRSLPDGKKVVAVILLGSYSIGQSTPDSDIDFQLMTQDGSPDAISPDHEAVRALSKTDFSPKRANAWSRLRGAAFAAFYRAWCWTYLRWADLLHRP